LQRFTKTYKENHVEYISIFKDLQKLIKQTTLKNKTPFSKIYKDLQNKRETKLEKSFMFSSQIIFPK
jgi:hypothetical protein